MVADRLAPGNGGAAPHVEAQGPGAEHKAVGPLAAPAAARPGL